MRSPIWRRLALFFGLIAESREVARERDAQLAASPLGVLLLRAILHAIPAGILFGVLVTIVDRPFVGSRVAELSLGFGLAMGIGFLGSAFRARRRDRGRRQPS